MDPRILLVQSIALLFWESLIPESGKNSKEIVLNIINSLPAPEGVTATDDDRENLIALRDIAQSMALRNGEEQYDKDFLLSKVKLSIKKDPELRDDITGLLEGETTPDKVLIKVDLLQKELNKYFTQKDFLNEMKKLASKTIYAGAPAFKVSDMAKLVSATMERFIDSETNANDDPALNGMGDTESEEELAKHFMNVQEDLDVNSVIKTGWQRFNRMCGDVDGLRRGNMYVIGARPSNGKSLVTSCLTLHSMMFNKPYLFDPTKKPCILHISTENDIPLNMRIWFKYWWEYENNAQCNILEMDPAYMAKWFIDHVKERGYTFKFYHIDPTNTSYREILSKFMDLEAQGFEIQLAAVDYLAMINGDGLGDENRAFWIRQLFKVMRNYCNPRRITLLTPHQVATDAAMLLRQGSTDFVKQIAGKRYWSECRSIDMEVDMEIVCNIEHDAEKNAWMAFARGKDRSSQGTPEKDCSFFIPFSKFGGLRPDLETKDSGKSELRDNTGISVDASAWMGAGADDF